METIGTRVTSEIMMHLSKDMERWIQSCSLGSNLICFKDLR